ncbi:MAG: DNA repair protein RecO [Ectothiorhodospiraceae bacterium]
MAQQGPPAAAWVLHRRSYRDTSLLVELLTQENGRIGAVARGARQQRSRWRGRLEPFQPVLVNWLGRGELATLTNAESSGRFLQFPGTRLAAAFYISELVLRLVRRGEPLPGVFLAYGDALTNLAEDRLPEDGILRVFEKRLLDALGYGLLLEVTADDHEPVAAAGWYRYELEYGPVAVTGSEHGLTVSGRTLLALAAEDVSETARARQETQRLMRAALRLYIGTRPLQSRAFYASLKRTRSANGKESDS